jgi:hypothetical protein
LSKKYAEPRPSDRYRSRGRLDVQRAPVERQRAAVVVELVALGVAAEVVVIVEHEHPGASADVLQEVMRGGEAAQPSPHHDEVVALAGVRRAGKIPAARVT